MPQTITDPVAVEGSSYKVSAAFTDENGDAVSPDSMTWTLLDEYGAVVNSREDVSIASPGSSESIVLQGSDLALSAGQVRERRVVVFEGEYTSDAGSGLPLVDYVTFLLVDSKV